MDAPMDAGQGVSDWNGSNNNFATNGGFADDTGGFEADTNAFGAGDGDDVGGFGGGGGSGDNKCRRCGQEGVR